jgi:hypothetical protein
MDGSGRAEAVGTAILTGSSCAPIFGSSSTVFVKKKKAPDGPSGAERKRLED